MNPQKKEILVKIRVISMESSKSFYRKALNNVSDLAIEIGKVIDFNAPKKLFWIDNSNDVILIESDQDWDAVLTLAELYQKGQSPLTIIVVQESMLAKNSIEDIVNHNYCKVGSTPAVSKASSMVSLAPTVSMTKIFSFESNLGDDDNSSTATDDSGNPGIHMNDFLDVLKDIEKEPPKKNEKESPESYLNRVLCRSFSTQPPTDAKNDLSKKTPPPKVDDNKKNYEHNLFSRASKPSRQRKPVFDTDLSQRLVYRSCMK